MFSCTVMVRKICGPAARRRGRARRARGSAGRPRRCRRPSISPDFVGIMPISDFNSVDLPMPLRPTTATISPGCHREVDAVQHLALAVGDVEICVEHRNMALASPLVAQIDFHDLRVGLDRLHVASARTLPWCSTVTRWAMLSTNSMSCSITITERFLMMPLSSSAVLTRSDTLMPATGSSSINSSGSWISSMPISSHCFWPWLKVSACWSRWSAR